jgi:dephospho-CoA kinase
VPTQPFKLGLTGGIGSGKSTVAGLLCKLGAGLIDADAISRTTTATGGDAISLIQAQFGAEFIDDKGALHRERMRLHIFTDPQARHQLESIIHPLVLRKMAEATQSLTQAGKTCIVMDIPLLVESGRWRSQLQRVLVVDCSAATQVSRVMARSALTAAEVQSIISAQASRERRLQAADMVLCNDGISLPALATEVQQLAVQFGL